MSGQVNRKALREQYEQTREAGVYRILNSGNTKSLLGSALNLASVRNRFAFAKSTNSLGGLDLRLSKDIRQFGFAAFSLEVLEVLGTAPEMTEAEIAEDLATLEGLWREKFDPATLY